MADELDLAELAEVSAEDPDGTDPLLLPAVVGFARMEDGFRE